jgi:lysophospholipase L1-like esterase
MSSRIDCGMTDRARTFYRYVAIGDSSTEGLDDPDGRGGYRGWANRLAERIASVQREPLLYANLGVRGLRTRRILETQLRPALEMRPDLVTLFCGTNDVVRLNFSARSVHDDVLHMQRALIAQGATVLGFTLPDLSPVMPLALPLVPRVRALNNALRDAAAESGAILVDFAKYPVGSDPRIWSTDRLHANADGHARIAAGLAHALALPGTDDTWHHPFPEPLGRSLAEQVAAEVRWMQEFFLPWMWRHLRGRSSADGRTAKRPRLLPVESS